MVDWAKSGHSSPPRAAFSFSADSASELATLSTISRLAFISLSTSANAGMLPATSFDMSTSVPNWRARVCITTWATTISSLKAESV